MRATSLSLPLASRPALISGPMPVTSPSIRPRTGRSVAVMRKCSHQAGYRRQRLEVAHHRDHVFGALLREPRELGVLAELVGHVVVAHGHRGAPFSEVGAAAH